MIRLCAYFVGKSEDWLRRNAPNLDDELGGYPNIPVTGRLHRDHELG
jgi:hypothetical protein